MRDTRIGDFRDAPLRDAALGEVLRTSVAHALVRLMRLQTRVFSAALKAHGLSPVQSHVLLCLWVEGPMTIGALQSSLALSSAAASGAVDRMEALGLVRRVADPSDRRASVLQPADWSKARRQALVETLTASEDQAYGGLDARERRQLSKLLAKAAKRL